MVAETRIVTKFLRERPDGGAHFRTHALPHLWPRLRRSLEEELDLAPGVGGYDER